MRWSTARESLSAAVTPPSGPVSDNNEDGGGATQALRGSHGTQRPRWGLVRGSVEGRGRHASLVGSATRLR
jgi:hypothetical protein